MTTMDFSKYVTIEDSDAAILTMLNILDGNIVVIPTDTVYGLSSYVSYEGTQKISEIKKSSPEKTYLVLVSSIKMLRRFAHVTDLAWKLIENFTDKPLTLILFPRNKNLSAVQSSEGKVAFRIAKYPFLKKLIEAVDYPIVSTSANLSGHTCCYDVPSVVSQIGLEHVALVVDGGVLPLSLPSTVVDATGKKAIIVRDGVVSRKELTQYF